MRRPLAVAARLSTFLRYLIRRFAGDGCLRLAAGLSYASLLAMVPLFAISLALLAAFPAFDRARAQLQTLIFEVVPAGSGGAASEYFGRFLQNAEGLTGPGVLGLAVTAVLLLANVNSALNVIWRVQDARPVALRVLVYWALLTLGPLLVGASLSLSSYAFAVVGQTGGGFVGGWLVAAEDLLAPLLATAGFSLLYFVVPNRVLQFRHCLAGGLTAALLLEILKAGFGLYLQYFPSYQALYGALAAVPIFLVWTYLAWSVVLFGAELAAGLPEWLAAEAQGRASESPGERLALALALLGRLRSVHRGGRALNALALARGLPATPTAVDGTLSRLRRAHYVVRTGGGRLALARDLAAVDLEHLLRSLGLEAAPGDGWPEGAGRIARALAEAGAELRARDLESLLQDAEAAELRPRLVKD